MGPPHPFLKNSGLSLEGREQQTIVHGLDKTTNYGLGENGGG